MANAGAAVSDYQTALKAWQTGRNAPGEPMPESFRIGPALKRDPAQTAALERVRGWARERFALPEEAAVMVAQIVCNMPGCPPLETVVAFWTGNATRHQFKLFKPVAEVVADDLPPSWMKNALIVDEESSFECC
jgi:nitrate reductase delta subunit